MPEIGDRRLSPWSDDREQELVALRASEKNHHPSEAIVIETDDGATYYVVMNEGQPEVFGVYTDDPDFPHARHVRTDRGENFYSWLLNQQGRISTRPADEVTVCYWSTVPRES